MAGNRWLKVPHLLTTLYHVSMSTHFELNSCSGETVPGRDLDTVFSNMALRERFIKMWTTVAKHCKGLDMIAGYEIMSEPRVQDTPPEIVREFYRAACAAVHAEDSRTPCVVGAAPFYNLHGLEGAFQPDVQNIIYSFNFFIPRKYVNGDASLNYTYPGQMRCCDAHDKEHGRCCPGMKAENLSRLPCCLSPTYVDRKFLADELEAALYFREKHQVPIFMDQWAISRTSGRDRMRYVSDVLELLQKHYIHWAYWEWRQRDYDQMTVVRMNADWKEPMYDRDLIQVFQTVLGAPQPLESGSIFNAVILVLFGVACCCLGLGIVFVCIQVNKRFGRCGRCVPLPCKYGIKELLCYKSRHRQRSYSRVRVDFTGRGCNLQTDR